MEAALRSAYFLLMGKNIEPEAFTEVRGLTERRELEVTVAETKVRCAVVSSLGEARKLIEDVRAGRCEYDFVEVMACPGGCVDGGGTIRAKNAYLTNVNERAAGIYAIDEKRPLRQSHNNPDVMRLYKEFLGKPLSEAAEELLHTGYRDRKSAPKHRTITRIWQDVQPR